VTRAMEGSRSRVVRQLDAESIKCIGVIPAMHKRRIGLAVKEVVDWLASRRVKVLLPAEQAGHLSLPGLASEIGELADCADLVLSMGGDGTFLRAARTAAPRGKPILGINLGGFGFLASLPSGSGMIAALAAALDSRPRIEERMMLEAVVLRKGAQVARFLALNDVVVGKGAFSRLFRLKTSISGETISYFPADGMIVATATGSTGYSLSAGGPVVEPEVRVIILTPICAHTLSARSLVVPPDRVIKMGFPELRGAEVKLTADGQEALELEAGDSVEVREAPVPARLVVLDDSSVYSRLREKLGWGGHR